MSVDGVRWSPWLVLSECFMRGALPAEPGLYRIRAEGDDVLAYVGQTGRTLRERVNSLRGVYGDEMPYRDPHTVGPALWAWVHSADVQLAASVARVVSSGPLRKGLEAVAIAEHRQEHGRSPRWNFGRMPVGYLMSSGNNARLVAAGNRFRGGRTDAGQVSHVAGVPPRGGLDPHVLSDRWSGHEWSEWRPMTADELKRVPAGTGLYRIHGRDESLVYVGEGRVRERLLAHAGKLAQPTAQGGVLAAAAPLEFSWVLDGGWLTHQRLELETDLIAAHVLAVGRPPAAQFIG